MKSTFLATCLAVESLALYPKDFKDPTFLAEFDRRLETVKAMTIEDFDHWFEKMRAGFSDEFIMRVSLEAGAASAAQWKLNHDAIGVPWRVDPNDAA